MKGFNLCYKYFLIDFDFPNFKLNFSDNLKVKNKTYLLLLNLPCWAINPII